MWLDFHFEDMNLFAYSTDMTTQLQEVASSPGIIDKRSDDTK